MRNFLIFIIVAFMTFSFALDSAYAKRFGGGRSFGVSRSVSANNFSRGSAMPNTLRSQGNRWLGPLLGLAAGGLLASLFMGNGIGTGIISWLIIGSIGLLLFSFLKRRQLNASAANYRTDHPFVSQYSRAEPMMNNQQSAFQTAMPAGFNSEEFLRQAKVTFLRLQAAYDQKNIDDIRMFTTPQVLAEIQMQFQERGDTPNQTEVSHLNAELINLDQEQNDMLASVLFSGTVRENPSETSEPLKEVWHFQQTVNNKWIVAGIQQTN